MYKFFAKICCEFLIEIMHMIKYNEITTKVVNVKPEMYDNLVYLEPTFTFMGFLYCQVAVKPSLACEDWKGRQKVGCGYPPSVARSQLAGGGILGIKNGYKRN